MAATTTTNTTRTTTNPSTIIATTHCNPHASNYVDAGHFRLRTSLFIASFRRRIIDTIRCGGAGCSPEDDSKPIPKPKEEPQSPPPVRSDQLESRTGRSEKLFDFLNIPAHYLDPSFFSCRHDGSNASPNPIASDCVGGGRIVEEKLLDEMSTAVELLQREDEDRVKGAKLVRSLAKDDPEARTALARLGAIPPLVGMLDDDYGVRIEEPLYALLNLGIGNDQNKAAIVQAGAIHKMLKLIDYSSSSILEAIVANFLALSALDSNKSVIGSSGAIPFLVKTLKDHNNQHTSQAKQDALRALYNLSILPSNLPLILETDLVLHLIALLGDIETSERILSILSSVVSIPEGRKAISSAAPDSFPVLIDVLHWIDSPGCQEKASYVLLVMAHSSYSDRRAMAEAGIASTLLELTLIGSTLAQKRASRILECLRMDKGKQILDGNGMTLTLSAPLCGGGSHSSNSLPRDLDKGRKDRMGDSRRRKTTTMGGEDKQAVKEMAQLSLQNNMRKIVMRANMLRQDFVPSEHLKTLTSSSTSKSLPL